MNEKIMISVIVPVYNTKIELGRCIESLINQTYDNIEIILIDDGSSDGSGKICDDYAVRNKNIKIIHQSNSGVVSARNAGIKESRGDYISFVDSDDYIEKNMYEELVGLVQDTNIEIISFGCIREYMATDVSKIPSAPEYDGLEEGLYSEKNKVDLYEKMICVNGYAKLGVLPYLWTKLIKRNLILDNLERISEEIAISEDACLNYMCFIDAKKILVIHRAYYHYCIRKDSSVHSIHKKCFAMLNESYNCLYKKIIETPEYQDILLTQLEKYVAKEAIYCLKNRFGFSNGGVLPLYTIKLDGIDRNTKLALYGAGSVGTSYYKQIKGLGQADIVLWVDKDSGQVERNAEVSPIGTLLEMEYDYILIAVKLQSAAEVIRQDLLNMGIAEEKILWEEPKFILDIYN